MLRVLQHCCIAQQQQVGYVTVDGHTVGDALSLWSGIAATVPVAKSYGGWLALRYGAQQSAGAGVALCGVEMYGVATGGAEVTVVDDSDMLGGVVVAAVAAGNICRVQVCVVYASCATLRSEGVEGVGKHRQAVAQLSTTAVGGVENIVGEGRESFNIVWRRRGIHSGEGVVAHGTVADADYRRTRLVPFEGYMVAFHGGHAETIGSAGTDLQVIDICDIVVLEA